jgi:hypothetical protein
MKTTLTMLALFLVITPVFLSGMPETADTLTLDTQIAISQEFSHPVAISPGITVTQLKPSTYPLNDAKLFATK